MTLWAWFLTVYLALGVVRLVTWSLRMNRTAREINPDAERLRPAIHTIVLFVLFCPFVEIAAALVRARHRRIEKIMDTPEYHEAFKRYMRGEPNAAEIALLERVKDAYGGYLASGKAIRDLADDEHRRDGYR